MSFIMIIYYIISLFIAIMLVWNFFKEKKSIEQMILTMIVLIPILLRLLRLK